MTEVYVFDLSEAVLPESVGALLPPWRRERWERLRHAPARRASLGAGLLYAWAMVRRGVPADAPVTLLPAGKPVLAGREDVYFSLSHSGPYALCAVSGRPVGADVQAPRTVKPTVARRFHPAEQAWLAEQADWEESFFRLWTRKEAWVKAMSGERMLALDETDVIHPPAGMRFRDYSLPGACAAVCAAEDIAGPVFVTEREMTEALAR